MMRTLDLDNLILESGNHEPDHTFCMMEAVAFLAGEEWSDAPACVSPVIAAFCRVWNDTPEPYGSTIRLRLKLYIPRVMNSRGGDAREEQRSWLAGDWLMRIALPIWLRAAGLADQAIALESLPEQRSYDDLVASTAARVAARDAAWDAAWAAARDAARVAAWDAAWDAAWAAAWDAARTTAQDATRDAARAAAWAAAWAAARVAADKNLQPVIEQLQESAWQLLDRMLKVTEDAQQG